jgi:hypothetical protein
MHSAFYRCETLVLKLGEEYMPRLLGRQRLSRIMGRKRGEII